MDRIYYVLLALAFTPPFTLKLYHQVQPIIILSNETFSSTINKKLYLICSLLEMQAISTGEID